MGAVVWAETPDDDRDEAAETEAPGEVEFAEVYARHDRILRELGSLDPGDLVLELDRLLRERIDVRTEIAARFTQVMADELEDTGAAHRRPVESLAARALRARATGPGRDRAIAAPAAC